MVREAALGYLFHASGGSRILSGAMEQLELPD